MLPLPPELWIQIFEIATLIPSELNSNATSIFERSTHSEAQDAREINLPTRRALPLVSRTFYQLSNRFLYKSILIRRGVEVKRLLRTLVDSLHNGDEVHGSHGRWTKRLDVEITRSRHWRGIGHEEIFHLLPVMPNLEIFVGFGMWSLPDDRLMIMGLQSCRHLKMVFLPSSILPQYQDGIFPLVTSAPLTSSLRIFYPNQPGSSLLLKTKQEAYFDSSQGRNFVALTVSDAWIQTHAARDPDYFPHLRTLHVYGDICTAFIVTHGHKITTLDLEISGWRDATPLLPHLPNLRRIVLDLVSVVDLAIQLAYGVLNPIPANFISDKVKMVGVTVNSSQAPHQHYSAIFRLLPELFPKMEVLRILERNIVNTLGKQPGRVRKWHTDLMEKRVRLEREDGELLIEDCQK